MRRAKIHERAFNLGLPLDARREGSRGSGLLRRRIKREIRHRVVDAFIGVVANKGYSDGRLEEVVRAVEIVEPEIYSYFCSKEELVAEVGLGLLDRVLFAGVLLSSVSLCPVPHIWPRKGGERGSAARGGCRTGSG